MRNAIIRILQALVLVAVAASFAQAGDHQFAYFKKKAVAGVGGTPADGNIMNEGFEVATTGYENTWVDNGSQVTVTPAEARPGTQSPTGLLNQSFMVSFSAANQKQLVKWSAAGEIDAHYYRAYFYISDGLGNGYAVRPLELWDDTGVAGYLEYNNSAGQDRIRFNSSTNSGYINITSGAWHYIEVFYDANATGTVRVDGGGDQTFTCGTRVPKHITIGVVTSQATATTYYLDLIAVDSTDWVGASAP